MTQLSAVEKAPGGPAGGRASPVVRFAPSPTGRLHLGHAMAALFGFRFAQATGGRFLLRIEDTDTGRARPEFIEGIHEDLAWLGLEWEAPVRRQCEHLPFYRDELAKLTARGLTYRCFATRSEIRKHAATAGTDWPCDPDGAPFPPGPADPQGSESDAERPVAGETAAVRLDMAAALSEPHSRALTFQEIGTWAPETASVDARPGKWGDVVLGRKDTGTSYHLSVVLDDALQGVTHVVRGLDLYEATHLHRLLQSLLGLPVPFYCHHPLILDDAGRKLAKTIGSRSLAELRADGATAEQVRSAAGLARFDAYFAQLAASVDPQKREDHGYRED